MNFCGYMIWYMPNPILCISLPPPLVRFSVPPLWVSLSPCLCVSLLPPPCAFFCSPLCISPYPTLACTLCCPPQVTGTLGLWGTRTLGHRNIVTWDNGTPGQRVWLWCPPTATVLSFFFCPNFFGGQDHNTFIQKYNFFTSISLYLNFDGPKNSWKNFICFWHFIPPKLF